MPRVYDCFQFYNEFDVLEIRLAELDPLVDHFVLVEATHTHTGKPKPLHFTENRKRYERYAHKIIHVVIDDLPLDDPSHFARDIHQREAILRGLGGAQPDDRILFSDCDEIPKPHLLRKALGVSRPVASHRRILVRELLLSPQPAQRNVRPSPGAAPA